MRLLVVIWEIVGTLAGSYFIQLISKAICIPECGVREDTIRPLVENTKLRRDEAGNHQRQSANEHLYREHLSPATAASHTHPAPR